MNGRQPMSTAGRAAVGAVLAGVLVALLAGQAVAQTRSCGAPPPAKPQRIKGGESFPPLPLPVTPLRRTERKRPPAPPLLIAKLQYGEEKKAVTPDGRSYTYLDWKSDPGDAARLLNHAKVKLGVNYRVAVVSTAEANLDPAKTPIVYITGHDRFMPSGELQAALRNYVLAGGTVWGDACCGSGEFAESFMAFIRQTFPQRRFDPLPPEHPLFKAFFPIQQVTFQDGTRKLKEGVPEIFAVEIGCRAAVLAWRYDLSCGWDGHTHDVGLRIAPEDAVRLGVNMLAYTLSYQPLGRFMARRKVFHDAEGALAPGAFVFGQLVHEGDWDPDPSGVANLLKAANANSNVPVKFVRRRIEADDTALFDVPFLYMTGHHDFRLSDGEVRGLRDYLTNGGFLFADACCGRAAFDAAFRREMKRVLPERKLEPILPDDPVHHSAFETQQVRLIRGDTAPNALEGIKVDGFWAVVYSPRDLGNGWEDAPHPWVEGVASEDSYKVAINAMVYALTH